MVEEGEALSGTGRGQVGCGFQLLEGRSIEESDGTCFTKAICASC